MTPRSAPIGAPRERPIIFSGAEVRAILAGHLTQTRRPVKHDFMHRPDGARHAKWYIRARRDGIWDSYETLAELVARHCPYGVTGDRLWVRETWAVRYQLDDLSAGGEVALELGRRSILIELNPEYLPLIEKRLQGVQYPLALETRAKEVALG